MSHQRPTKSNRNVAEGLTLRQKAKILRAHRGAIQEIAAELGKTHTVVSRTLDGKYDMHQPWVQHKVLPAIDRKVNEILALNSIKDNQIRRKGKP